MNRLKMAQTIIHLLQSFANFAVVQGGGMFDSNRETRRDGTESALELVRFRTVQLVVSRLVLRVSSA